MNSRFQQSGGGATAALLALLASGCLAVTVNVTFPQEKIDDAAASIEDMVRAPKSPPASVPARPSGSSSGARERVAASSARAVWAWLGPAVAEAQVPSLKTETKEIRVSVESRRARLPTLSAAMAQGCVGENNQGLVEARPGAGCSANVGTLVAAENNDRMLLYRTLLEQNNMPASDLGRVQAGFARAHRQRVPAGAWIQDDGGEWARK
jgi:uncharacterized protein YdbL (DUF1318 family)